MILLFLLIALLYTYVAVALAYWGVNERAYDIFVAGALMTLWPVSLPVGYLYSAVRLRIKWRKYRGGRYLRKTFDAAAIDAHFERMASYGRR
jgi:hypothetical protein